MILRFKIICCIPFVFKTPFYCVTFVFKTPFCCSVLLNYFCFWDPIQLFCSIVFSLFLQGRLFVGLPVVFLNEITVAMLITLNKERVA